MAGRPGKAKRQAAYLDALRELRDERAACERAGVTPRSVRNWRSDDAGFSEREAEAAAGGALDDLADPDKLTDLELARRSLRKMALRNANAAALLVQVSQRKEREQAACAQCGHVDGRAPTKAELAQYLARRAELEAEVDALIGQRVAEVACTAYTP